MNPSINGEPMKLRFFPKPNKKMTADEALEAHIARFGFIPWGLPSLPDDAVVRAVEKALETVVPCEDGPLPPGCIQ